MVSIDHNISVFCLHRIMTFQTTLLLVALCLSKATLAGASKNGAAIVSGTKVNVVRNIFGNDDGFSPIYEHDKPAIAESSPGRRRVGTASLSSSFVHKIRTFAGLVFDTNGHRQGLREALVPITLITSTTDSHVDTLGDKEDWCDDEHFFKRSPVKGRVGFVALETNLDAYFLHGDVSILIEKGSFIHFDGGVPHNTVVNSGSVKLLGPFHMSTFRNVGFQPRFPPSNDNICDAFFMNLHVSHQSPYSVKDATAQPFEVTPGPGSGAVFDNCQAQDGW
jgi:hypothetical protein